jgi:hypothetical protein
MQPKFLFTHRRLAFGLRFIFLFGMLVAPWPGWNDHYADFFRSFGQRFLNRENIPRLVSFSPSTGPTGGLDTRLTLANRAQRDASGHGMLLTTSLATRSIGWIPTALTVALIMSTPIPWGRRVSALVLGLVLVHVFILFCLQTWVWSNSSQISLMNLSTFWQRVADELNYAFLNQLGASFAVPVLIWILVTFKQRDANILS